MQVTVGPVERIELGKVIAVCACCNLHVECCRCEHDKTILDTKCPKFHSTF